MLFANVVMFVFMIGSVRWIARLARTPRHVLLPVIMGFCVVGSYALNNRLFDVWVMLAFGLAGFLLERCKVPLAPFVIGFVLAPIAEKKLGAGLQASNGSWSAAPMVAVAEDFLRHSKEYSKSGCTIWVDIGMTVCGLGEHSGRGTYDATITSDGGAICSAYASSLGLPLDCSASGRWWIRR